MRVSRTMITPYANGPVRSGSGVDNFTVLACRCREWRPAVAQSTVNQLRASVARAQSGVLAIVISAMREQLKERRGRAQP